MATLLYIITEGIQGGPFELTEGTHVIGSAEGVAILIPDTTISAQHGQFDITQGQIVYQDLGSQNGSFVNEQQVIQPVALTPGHILQVGQIHLQIIDDPSVVETMKPLRPRRSSRAILARTKMSARRFRSRSPDG